MRGQRLPARAMPSPSLRRFFALIAIFFIAFLLFIQKSNADILLKSVNRSGAVLQTPHVRAELVAHAPEGVQPGQTLWLGLLLEHKNQWHSYWKNPGDSGLPTELLWQLPQALTAGTIQWPVPQALPVPPLRNYGYENQVLLPVPVAVAADFQPPASGVLAVRLHANWLVCRVECIPEAGDFHLNIAVQGSTAGHGALFARARAAQPQALHAPAQARVVPGQGAAHERVQLRIAGLPEALHGQWLDFYPESPDTFVHAAEPGKDWQQRWDGGDWLADLPLSGLRGATPETLPVVLALPEAERAQALAQQRTLAWRSVAQVQGRWTPAAISTTASISPALADALAADASRIAATALPAAGSSAARWWASLLGGLLGGLLLNLMPCVFPVLAIKILGFSRHGQDRRAQRLNGLAYMAGVVLSFLALGGLLLGLRAAGEQLGWGFQLQSPAIVTALAALFTLLGLNLAGVFEVGSLLPARWAAAHARRPALDAALSGVLAVGVAAPCTAPFMGAALGFAIDMPPLQALTVFAALGLGMGAPYLLAALVPALLRWLPRPGAWMQTFRHAMAFPMFATVVWLLWVLGQQSGIDAVAAVLALLLALGALVWSLTLTGRSRALLAPLALAGLATLLYGSAALIAEAAAPVAAHAPDTTAGQRWQAWSAPRLSQLQAQGQPVFVDFTAAWCVTCQVNKRTLQHPEVLAAFEQRGVALLRADWTRRDSTIAAALQELGRSGVPVYVLYTPGQRPHILGELLSKGEVLAALAAL